MGAFKIVENGNAKSAVIVQEQNMEFAAKELQKYIRKISGCNIGISYVHHNISELAIENQIVLKVDKESGIAEDGFVIEVQKHCITLISSNSRGVLYAVYDLLEKLGCEWIYPIEDEQIIPNNQTIELEESSWKQEPRIKYRGLALYGVDGSSIPLTYTIIDWMAKNRYNLLMTSICRHDDSVEGKHGIHWLQIQDDLLPELKKREIVIHMSEHSTDYFFPRSSLYESHKDWFALKGEERIPEQMCYSNRNAIEYLKDAYVDFVKKHPEIDMIGIWPLDGPDGYCECENCKNPLTIFKTINYIAREIKKVRADITVEHLAYVEQSFAVPDMPIEDNLSVLVCRRTDEVAKNWVVATKNKGGSLYFEYNTSDNYCMKGNVWIDPYYTKNIVNTISEIGFDGMVSLFLPIQSWWVGCFNYHFMKEAYYNANFDVKTGILEYCKKAYGESNAPIIAKALDIEFKQVQNPQIWFGFPFGKCKEYNKVSKFRQDVKGYIDNIFKLLGQVDQRSMTEIQRKNYNRLKKYIQYNGLYYKLVDTCAKGEESRQNVEELFTFLRDLDEDSKCAFTSEGYTRWRIVGRDAVL